MEIEEILNSTARLVQGLRVGDAVTDVQQVALLSDVMRCDAMHAFVCLCVCVCSSRLHAPTRVVCPASVYGFS